MRDDTYARIEGIARSGGATAAVTINEGYPITYNDLAVTARMAPTLGRVAGASNVDVVNAVLGAEDCSFFHQKVPGLFFWLGTRPRIETVNDLYRDIAPRASPPD
jgi:amidohydrolase